MRSGFAIESKSNLDVIKDLIHQEDLPFSKGTPNYLHQDHDSEKANENWMQRLMEWIKPNQSVSVIWGNEDIDDRISFNLKLAVGVTLENFDPLKSKLTTIFKKINFEVITIGNVYSEWSNIDREIFGFGDRHGVLGMGCAFRGAGHTRVVSRRALEYGPWLVKRDEALDITYIQFHDLDADANTALEQALPGHALMADPYEGIFIQTGYQILDEKFRPLYEADTKTIKIIVHGREVTKAEMLDACATRRWQLLGDNKPVERAAFMFMTEDEARDNLFELWLRELECWAIIKGVETRLDLDYTPPPLVKPQWVLDVEAREDN
jgi:hypothetical protein